MQVMESTERLLHRAWLVLFASCAIVMGVACYSSAPGADLRELAVLALGGAGQIVLVLLALYRVSSVQENDLVPLALAFFKLVSAAALLFWLAGPSGTADGSILLLIAGGDVGIAGLTLGAWHAAGRHRRGQFGGGLTGESPVDQPVRATRAVRVVLWTIGSLCGVAAALVLLSAPFASPTTSLIDYAGTNACALYATLSFLALTTACTGRYRIQHMDLLVAGTIVAGAALFLAITRSPPGAGSAQSLLWIAALHWIVAAVVVLSRKRGLRRDRFFGPWLTRAFEQFAEEIIPERNGPCTASELTTRVNDLLQRTDSPRLISLKAALALLDLGGLVYLRTPMSRMGQAERSVYIQRLLKPRIGLIRTLMELKRAVYFLYYADERVQSQVGFVKPEDRPGSELPGKQDRSRVGSSQSRPLVSARNLSADVCVIGSGAGGAVIAARLAEAGKRVVLLEEGPYLSDEDITHDEGAMQTGAYRDAGLQYTRDQGMGILQGRCVGGSTKVNNAVCFAPPEATLREWSELGARLDRASVRDCVKRVSRDLKTINLAEHKHLVNKGSIKFVEGCERLGLKAQYFDINVEHCIGCGYCTSGCRYGKKMSVDRSYIPRALEHGAVLVSDCEAKRIVTTGGRASRVECSRKDGRPLTVAAEQIVVSCGAIGSSLLLLRSGISHNVGTRLSFNVGSWVTAEFPEPVDSFDGFQMCAYHAGEDYCLETISMPPGGFAAIVPGGPVEHAERMRKYRFMTAAGVLVGTQATGRVAPTRLPVLRHLISPIYFQLSAWELTQLRHGLEDLCRIFLAAGAVRVYPATSTPLVITCEAEIAKLDQLIRKPSDLAYGSAHPQGGNPMSQDTRIGAVDTDFRVHGFENLFVCDASVFPSSCHVNPQVTVMSLAEHAADGLVGL